MNLFGTTTLIAAAVFILEVLCIETGFRIARGRQGKDDETAFNIVEAAAYSLVGLLLGFSFSLAVSHYDARRLLVVKEANAIGTTILRSQMLPPADAAEMHDTLRDYVNARLAFALAGRDQAAQEQAASRSDHLQQQMWEVALAQAARAPGSQVTALFVSTLNDTIDTSSEESEALNADIPSPVVGVLIVVILLSGLLLGYGFGQSGRNVIASLLFAIMLALVVAVVLDLDNAQAGLIRVSVAPLRALQTDLAVPAR